MRFFERVRRSAGSQAMQSDLAYFLPNLHAFLTFVRTIRCIGEAVKCWGVDERHSRVFLLSGKMACSSVISFSKAPHVHVALATFGCAHLNVDKREPQVQEIKKGKQMHS